MKTVCLGLLVFFVCEEPKPAVSHNECGVWSAEVQQFYKLDDAEIAALKPARKRAILSLRRKYERLCLTPSKSR